MTRLAVLLLLAPALPQDESPSYGLDVLETSLKAVEEGEVTAKTFATDFVYRYGSRGVLPLAEAMSARPRVRDAGASALLAYVKLRATLPPAAVRVLIDLARSEDAGAVPATWALAQCGADDAVETLVRAAGGGDRWRAEAGCAGLALVGGPEAAAVLSTAQAGASSEEVRYAAGKAIEVRALLAGSERREAVRALVARDGGFRGTFGGWLAQPALIGLRIAMKEILSDLAPELRTRAVASLAQKGRSLDEVDFAQRLLFAAHVLGGTLSSEETDVLRKRGFLDRP
jgi:hypothetical protein